MSKFTRKIVDDLKATWGTKEPEVKPEPITKGERKYWKDKWTVIQNHYGKKNEQKNSLS